MSSLDPLAISIIGKAIDFLFDQASKTIDKKRKKQDAEIKQKINKDKKEEILQSLIGRIDTQEVDHCLKQIESQTGNKQKLEIQIATYGTEADAPLRIVNQLHNVESELNKWINKLESLIEEASTEENYSQE